MSAVDRGVRARVADWFLGAQPIDALVLARIILAAVLFLSYLTCLSDVQLLYGPNGLALAGPSWVHPDRLLPAWIHELSAAAPPPSEGLIWLLYAVELIAALCFGVGYRTRSAGCIALLVHLMFVRARVPLAYWGWSLHIIPILLFVSMSRCGSVASIDAWLAQRRGRAAPSPREWMGSAWPLRLVQLHTCSMYLVSGGERIDDLGWLEGTAIWFAMSNSLFSKWAFNWHDLRLPMALGTWYTYAFEPLSAVLLWFRWTGPAVAYMAIAMHVGLELLTNVGWWNYVMIAGLLTFLPASHTRAIVARLPGARLGNA